MKSCHWNNIVIEVHSCLPATPRLQRFGTSKQVLWRKSFTFILFVYHFWSMRLNPRCSGVLRTSIMTIFGGNLKIPILSFLGRAKPPLFFGKIESLKSGPPCLTNPYFLMSSLIGQSNPNIYCNGFLLNISACLCRLKSFASFARCRRERHLLLSTIAPLTSLHSTPLRSNESHFILGQNICKLICTDAERALL